MNMIEESDCELPKKMDSCWIGVDNLSVYIKRTDEGVVLDVFARGRETDDAIASTYAYFAEGGENPLDNCDKGGVPE